MDFSLQMNNWIQQIEPALEESIPKQKAFSPVLMEAMSYSLMAGGKRLRPMMILEACTCLGGDPKEAMPFACAMEMIHTYSLIHDDLPAMDNDDYRRGRLTNHKVFGENMAILAGDGLFHHAAEIMSNACLANPCKKTVAAMQTILHGAGIHGMLVGQVVDVYFEGKPMDAEILDFIHINKTAAMIAAALKSGAILGGADDALAEKFHLAGIKIGVAFQILDDVLDVEGDQETLGKPIGSDEKNQKITYVTLFGIQKSKEIASKLSDEAIAIWQEIGVQCAFLEELTKKLTCRTY
ncbi:farnesyl diphosphate synthase [Chakrabartyella piscis]|uniref:polyprenyl synthetase family protein n=1 Tax=Chakrabartyella piscis TaxID=2918914 RepID=UPI0029585388|nr:farnesyl diphosphate synthase [Chakrabartyella piscis]